MTIGFTKKLLVGASAMMLALGAAPAGFAGEDDGPTANGEQIGSTHNGSSNNGSSHSTSNGSSSNGASAKSGVLGVQHTLVAQRDATQAVGSAQTGFGGMAETPGGSLMLALLLGLGGATLLGAAKVAPLDRRSSK